MFDKSKPLENTSCNKQVSVYLRKVNKHAKKILISNRVAVKEIMQIVEVQFSIPKQLQLLYFASSKYTFGDESILQLSQRSIIHIHNIQKCHLKQFKLSLQQIRNGGSLGQVNQYIVKSNQKISNFVQRCFQSSELILIESGRKLDQQATFQESQIEDGSNIYYLLKQKQLNNEQFEQDFNKLFQQQQNQQQQPQQNEIKIQQIAQTKKQQKIIQNLTFKAKEIQKIFCDQIQFQQSQPNFKKKKIICLKAFKTDPLDTHYIWKRDPSFSLTKNNNNKLIRALKGKKRNSIIHKDTQNSTSDQKMNNDAKLKLRQQFKKLFRSENLGLKRGENNKINNFFGNQIQNFQKKSRSIQETEQFTKSELF